jgi:hypothetical protein
MGLGHGQQSARGEGPRTRDGMGHTVKKGYRFSCPQPGCHLPNSPWPGIFKLSPARESLVSDIPAGDRKNDNLFLQCMVHRGFGWTANEGAKGRGSIQPKTRNRKIENL